MEFNVVKTRNQLENDNKVTQIEYEHVITLERLMYQLQDIDCAYFECYNNTIIIYGDYFISNYVLISYDFKVQYKNEKELSAIKKLIEGNNK